MLSQPEFRWGIFGQAGEVTLQAFTASGLSDQMEAFFDHEHWLGSGEAREGEDALLDFNYSLKEVDDQFFRMGVGF